LKSAKKKPAIRKAILLAAGRGGRLHPLTKDRPKALLRVGDRTIIEHQIASLRSAGIEEITIVTGHGETIVKRTCGDGVRYIHNSLYDRTNSLYSLWLAREFGRDGCLVLNCDVLFHPRILRALLDSPHADCLLVDFRSELGEEEMKVVTRNGKITQISKNIPPTDADGENVGVIKLGAVGARLVFDVAEECAKQGQWSFWVPFAVQSLLERHSFYAVPTNRLPWIEIDYVHDLERARKEVLPAIVKSLEKS
jgi:choline kinase